MGGDATFGASTGQENENDDDEQIKSRRLGSLGRIIANTAMVVERTESNSTIPPNVDELALFKQRKSLLNQFFEAFNIGNMTGLANLIQEHCSETCELVTPDLMEPIHGRAAIMMFFSLYFENFPDGIYREMTVPIDPSTQVGPIVSLRYTFMGTCVLGQSIQLLYDQVREHWLKVQASARIEETSLIDNIVENSWIPTPKMNASGGMPSIGTSIGAKDTIPVSNSNSVSKSLASKGGPSSSTLLVQAINEFQSGSASSTSPINMSSTASVATTPLPVSQHPQTATFASPLIFVPPSSSLKPLPMTLSSESFTTSQSSMHDMLPPQPPTQSSLWSLSPPISIRKSINLGDSSVAAASSIASAIAPPPVPAVTYQRNQPAKAFSSQPAVTPWLMKTLQALSSSFGKVAGKMASSLSLRERQTKHKRVMDFDFSSINENNNFISKIVISSYSKT